MGVIKKHHIKPRWIISGVVILLTGLALLGYVQYSKFYPSTDDAYVQAHVVYIASEVSGKVDKVLVQNHQAVKAGQLLFTVQPAQYRYALAQALANEVLAKEQEAVSKTNIDVAKEKANQARAELMVSRNKAHRIIQLVMQKQAAKEMGDEAQGKYEADKAALNAALSSWHAAKIQYQIAQQKVKGAIASYQQAKLNYAHTKIYAPATGSIASFSLHKGAYVSPGQSLFALVDTGHFWVDANFKETQLARMVPNQTVDVLLDMYPGVTFKGKVASISRGSGATFSLLPPENATGNWVKVTQRFPVKINLDRSALFKNHPLRVGASATVVVNTA